MTVHRFLVTMAPEKRMCVWAMTMYGNWIEGRENGPNETWLVTVMEEYRQAFINAVTNSDSIALQEIEGAGGNESYVNTWGSEELAWPPKKSVENE